MYIIDFETRTVTNTFINQLLGYNLRGNFNKQIREPILLWTIIYGLLEDSLKYKKVYLPYSLSNIELTKENVINHLEENSECILDNLDSRIEYDYNQKVTVSDVLRNIRKIYINDKNTGESVVNNILTEKVSVEDNNVLRAITNGYELIKIDDKIYKVKMYN